MIFQLTYFILLFMIMHVPAKQTAPITAVTFSSGTRGYSEQIHITPDSIFVEKNGFRGASSYKAALDEAAWQNILNSLQDVDLAQIHKLPAPSMNRASDGAMFSKLVINSSQSTYTSQEFDNHHPPRPLVPLMKAIDSLVMQEE